jgi:hypothetical protein
VRALALVALSCLLLLLLWWTSGSDAARVGTGKRERPGGAAVPQAAEEAASSAPEASGTAVEPAGGESPRAADLEALTFRVVDESRTPVADARAEVRRSERDDATDRAVSDGLGNVTVRLTKDDLIFVGARGFMLTRVRSPLRRRVAEVVLRRGYRIAGVVVDSAGRGIAGAELTLEQPFLPVRTAPSGPRGRFAFEDVWDDQMMLHVQADGYNGGGATVMPGDADVRIVLLRPMSAVGVVVFPDGTPAAGARVSERTTDKEGRVTLDLVPGHMEFWATLEAEDRSWTAHSAVEVAEDGTHDPIRLVLEPKPRSWVRVRVLERDGSPVDSVLVEGRGAEGAQKTDKDGRATCAFDLAPGTETSIRVVQTREDGLLPGRAAVVTGARDVPEILLRPRDPLRVTVVVRDSDGAALPAGVTAGIKTYGNPVVRRERDAAVVAVDPMAAEFSMTVSAPGFTKKFVHIPPPGDGHAEVRLLGTGTVRCLLADEAGNRVPGGFVQAWVARAGSATADHGEADGTYRIVDVPVGHALVTAGYDEALPLAKVEADVRAGEVADLGTLVLHAPRTLSGRILDGDGRPIGGAQVYAVTGEDETQVFSRSDGTFRVQVPPWFDGFVLATKPGHGSAYKRATETLELVMPAEGKVRLEVRLPPLTAGSRAVSLAARDPSTGFQWSRVEWARIEGTTLLVSGLPPGRLVLRVETQPKSAETEVVVVAGETVSAVIDVPR